MNGDDPAFDADDMGALFRAVLDQPEPAAPPELLPEVRRSGNRLRRRRRLLATVATAAAVGLLATAGWAVRGRSPAEHDGRVLLPAASAPVAPSVAPSPSASASPTPSVTPSPMAGGTAGGTDDWTEDGTDGTDGTTTVGVATEGSPALFALLRAHPPEEIGKASRGVSSENFLLTRKDGGTVAVTRRLDGPSGALGGATSPCGTPMPGSSGPKSPEGEDCVGMKLPDGSMVWAMHPVSVTPRGREAALRLVTPDELAYTLLFVRAEARPYPQPDDPTVALPQLLILAGQSGFRKAVQDGWGDPVTAPPRTRPSAGTPGPSTSPRPPALP
ncbi:hypothetical protein ACFV0O_18505 [Kitasatospora sp. NPDC059577]|uniref:hypothetical protein n=1 Tax=Kitasatospora sp. NPDC059577 TaxID=3346873 RepID=UPI00369218B0